MANCVICGKDSGKGKTCSSTCRSKLSRSVAKGVASATVEPVSVANATVDESDATVVTPEGLVNHNKLPVNYGQPSCECMHCQSKRVNKSHNILNHGAYKTALELSPNEINRVSLPGDPDYTGVCLDAKYDDRRIAG